MKPIKGWIILRKDGTWKGWKEIPDIFPSEKAAMKWFNNDEDEKIVRIEIRKEENDGTQARSF